MCLSLGRPPPQHSLSSSFFSLSTSFHLPIHLQPQIESHLLCPRTPGYFLVPRGPVPAPERQQEWYQPPVPCRGTDPPLPAGPSLCLQSSLGTLQRPSFCLPSFPTSLAVPPPAGFWC